MQINKKEFIEIFRSNFKYSIENTPIGIGVRMTAYDAFIYSSVTGAGYFDDPFYQYCLNGLLEVFNSALDYSFVTGIFDDTVLTNTPLYMSKSKDYLFNGDKFIVPMEFEREADLQERLQKKQTILKNKNIRSTDFIIQRIEKSKKGNGMEPFMEYLAAESFKKQGYIVETQIPLPYGYGSPDFSGYMLKNISSNVISRGYFKDGLHLIELSLLRLFNKRSSHFLNQNNISNINKVIVGEAKTSTKRMTDQLQKYLDTGLFEEGYEIHPSKLTADRTNFGLLSLDNNFKINVNPPLKPNICSSVNLNKENYFNWLENYMKYYIFANFTNEELNEVFRQEKGYDIESSNDLSDFINNYPLKDSFDLIDNLSVI